MGAGGDAGPDFPAWVAGRPAPEGPRQRLCPPRTACTALGPAAGRSAEAAAPRVSGSEGSSSSTRLRQEAQHQISRDRPTGISDTRGSGVGRGLPGGHFSRIFCVCVVKCAPPPAPAKVEGEIGFLVLSQSRQPRSFLETSTPSPRDAKRFINYPSVLHGVRQTRRTGQGIRFPFAFVPRPQDVSPLNVLSKSKHVSFEEGV